MVLSKKCSLAAAALLACIMVSAPVMAEPKKSSYTEQEFLNSFGNKTTEVVAKELGQPLKKEQSVKPTNASNVLGRPTEKGGKQDQVEMWYYKDLVKYDAKRTYKTIELTFVNDRCVNIAFFNNR
ncbi:hypothetical protein LG201_03890 [Methylobacillus gramineus]|uniref:hypothetical protein n=1 Tax=Methylobacillus gramineus TaxID=755169 RepID=UPI001CFF6A50|nr:hypothetical protein [Methylobacillus gramineus]MCB5184340.1 hypothetical protein [Methylobacillus gramineus]